MDEDIPHVRDAAKVSLGELSKDMAQLRAGLKDVAREIEFHRTQSPLANDKFVPVMREFQATATCRLAEIEDQYQDMKVRLRRIPLTATFSLFYSRPVLKEPFVSLGKTPPHPNLTNSSEFLTPSLRLSWRRDRTTRTCVSGKRRRRNGRNKKRI